MLQSSFRNLRTPKNVTLPRQQQCSFITIVKQYQKGVTLTLGKLTSVKEPGLRIRIPIIQNMRKVDMRITVYDLPSQHIITKDNVSANVSAVAYFKIEDAVKATLGVEDVSFAISQLLQTEMRDVLCKQVLNEILVQRNELGQIILQNVKPLAEKWGVEIERIQMKKIDLVDPVMVRAMAKEAEAARDKTAAIIRAEGELEAAKALLQAAQLLGENLTAVEIRRLQTIEKISKEPTQHTVVVPLDFQMGNIGVTSASMYKQEFLDKHLHANDVIEPKPKTTK